MKILHIIGIVLLFISRNVYGALAAEPHTDEDLIKYGMAKMFAATVQIDNDCSASRIVVNDEDPVEFYITAAHCFYNDDVDELDKFLHFLQEVNISNVKNLDIGTFVDKLLAEAIQNSESMDELSTREELIDQLADLIEQMISLKEDGFLERIPNSMAEFKAIAARIDEKHPRIHDRYHRAQIKYIKHPNPEIDLALFTLYEKRQGKPAYTLYPGKPDSLIGQDAISVGFGASAHKTNFLRQQRQAFNTKIEEYNNSSNLLSSEPYQAFVSASENDLPHGIATGGDSGGSLLIKDNQGKTYLVGVVEAASTISTNGTSTHHTFYSSIPNFYKSNKINQRCIDELNKDPVYMDDECYGAQSRWTAIDHEFIRQAREELLTEYNTQVKEEF